MTQEILNHRIRANQLFAERRPGLLAIVGPCSNQLDRRIVNEGRRLASIATESLVTIHRIPPWKPRTPVVGSPQPWKGLEHSNPVSALSRTTWEAMHRNVPIAIELGEPQHIEKYAHMLTMAWTGARSLGNQALHTALLSSAMQGIPLGIKNDLSGQLDNATNRIQILNNRLVDDQKVAPAVLIYRGGSDLKTPQEWEDQYMHAYQLTGGKLIVDTAHGGEQSHDRKGTYGKSVEGQIDCLEHLLDLSRMGYVPAGIMIEASDHADPEPYRQTDPNMPFDVALKGVQELHDIAITHAAVGV